MLSWLRSTSAAAGFSGMSARWLLGCSSLVVFVAGWLALELTHVPAFAVSLSVILTAFLLEYLNLRAKSRAKSLATAWPEVLDSLVSAAASGLSMFEAVLELASSGPRLLRPQFRKLEADLESGTDFGVAMTHFRDVMANANVDRLVELIRIISAAGGQGFHHALRNQAKQVRQDLALAGELESKQGWVTGTAKFAILAPWIVVLMLCVRPENTAAYSTTQGSGILLLGLLVSMFAYRLIQILGATGLPVRVFKK